MKSALVQKLQYRFADQDETHPLPIPLRDSLQLIANFFNNSSNNKLCLIFPSREFTAQWISIPLVISLIESDFTAFSQEMANTYKGYKLGDKLLLNSLAVVEWAGINPRGVSVRTKNVGESSGATITLSVAQATKLQKAPANRQNLSSHTIVKKAIPAIAKTPTEVLLEINANGNVEFIKNRICLLGKINKYEASVQDIILNSSRVTEYFRLSKIDVSGNVSESGPLLIANNCLSLAYYMESGEHLSKLIIDGVSTINDRISDFIRIDKEYNVPTILITDLSEIDLFEDISNLGFDFFNFTKEFLTVKESILHSPFKLLNTKLNKYISFNVEKILCTNDILESIAIKLHALVDDESNLNYTKLRIGLIQLFNLLSHVCHNAVKTNLIAYKDRLRELNELFQANKTWLGEVIKSIDDIISMFYTFLDDLQLNLTAKHVRLEELLSKHTYKYIVCPTRQEAEELRNYFHITGRKNLPQTISLADVNNDILSEKPVKVILTGWPKTNSMHRLLTSFLFSELTVLLYNFEDRYYNSLNKKYLRMYESSKNTVDKNGIHSTKPSQHFDHWSDKTDAALAEIEDNLDIAQFELKIDTARYAAYQSPNNEDNVKARRIDFDNGDFLYSIEAHKFNMINELLDSKKQNPTIQYKTTESLYPGDIIAFISTERETLVELVRKSTDSVTYASVKDWVELWKKQLRQYYVSIGSDFKKLVAELRKNHCKKHETTIKNWLHDDNHIGPEDDDDLVSIALVTKSTSFYNNIDKVRDAIKQMTNWRYAASDLVRDRIKQQLGMIANQNVVNSSVEIPDLGTVSFLKVAEVKKEVDQIDKKYIHRILKKEIS